MAYGTSWTIPYTQRNRSPYWGLPGTGAGAGTAVPSQGFTRINPQTAAATGENVAYGYPRDWGVDPTPGVDTSSPYWAPWSNQSWTSGLNQVPVGRTVQAASAGTTTTPTADRTVQSKWVEFIPLALSLLSGGGDGDGSSNTSGSKGQEALLALEKQLMEQYGMPLLQRGMGEMQPYSPETVSNELAQWRGNAEHTADTAITQAMEQARQRGLEYGSWLPGVIGQVGTELGKAQMTQEASLQQAEKNRVWQQLLSLLSAIPQMGSGVGQAAAGYGNLAQQQGQNQTAWWQSLASLLSGLGGSSGGANNDVLWTPEESFV